MCRGYIGIYNVLFNQFNPHCITSFVGDELEESDVDEVMERKRFPQQRFSPVNPARARSLTPEKGRYFSPIPVSRCWTPDVIRHNANFIQSSTSTFPQYRPNDIAAVMQQRKQATNISGNQESLSLQSGPKSAFTTIESIMKVNSTREEVEANTAVSKDSSSDENRASKTTHTSSFQGNMVNLSVQRSAPNFISIPTSNPTTTRQHNPILPGSSLLHTTTGRPLLAVPRMPESDKTTLANVQYGSIPHLVYSSCGNAGRDGCSFPGQGLTYHQSPSGSYVSPMVALPYPGGPLQDKMITAISPLSSQIPTSSVLRPSSNVVSHGGYPLVSTLFSPVVNIHLPQQGGAGMYALPDGSGLDQGGKGIIKNQTNEKDGTDKKHDGVQNQSSQTLAVSSGFATRQDNKCPGEKEGKTTKNILKKYVPDGMEQ